MARDWRSELVDLGDRVDAQAIVDAMTRAGYNKQQIAKTLEAFMAETPAAGPEAKPDTGTVLTVEQFIAMVKDPSKIEELKQILAKMDPKAVADLKAKIAPLLTSSDINAKYAQALSAMRKFTALTGKKFLPAKLFATILDNLQKGQYNKDYAVMAANQIMTSGQRGYNVARLHKLWVAYNKLGAKKGGPMEEDYSY
jgi:hypothetical protein